jgi:integrase
MGKGYDSSGARTMARALNRLSALKVTRAKEPGMYADGGSLYLRVAEGGSRQWIFRYVTNGRLRDMGLGPAHTLTLAEARERATEARKLRLDGIDPLEHRRARMAALRAADARTITFRECCEAYLRSHDASWTNARHRAQWRSTLEHLYPILGALPVQAIDTPLVLRAIKPIWEKTPVTASRLRGRLEAVLGWATVHHYRSGDNPAKWSGLLEHALLAPGKVAKVEHHSALPYADIPEFMAKVRADTGVTARALEFICLTAARSGEAAAAKWDEIDLDARLWTVPASRMKAGKEHRVPLSDPALAVLRAMRTIKQSPYVFPRGNALPVRGATVWRLATRLGGVSVHGLRSSFRDWASERTSFQREVCEMALAHTIPDAVEKAYRRGDLFDKRRKLMDAWGEFCAKPAAAGAVVPIRHA